MKIEVKRIYKGEEYTIGKMYVNGEYFCDTLEDKVRDIEKEGKVYAKTAIPYGEYKVIVNQSPKFGRMLPRLLDVPYFEGILIHRGNTHKDTGGCILIGENRIKGKVVNSTKYEEKLTALCHVAQLKGEEITITIRNFATK